MKIKKIDLYNFGSYEGENSFSFQNADDEKRVIVIGGKNGAGKTTLFTAIQVCLYGHYAFGFRTVGRHYLQEIYNLINGKIRMNEDATAYITLEFTQITGTEESCFKVQRGWTWFLGNLVERLTVWQNDIQLNDEELTNFQNYLIRLIPPDLLKLYFFDGEKVSNYFLGNREVNIRDALMVLSGNDTFDILYDNVRRVLKLNEGQNLDSAKQYLALKVQVDQCTASIKATQEEIESYQNSLENLHLARVSLTKDYTARGGVTIDEWLALHNELKEEEEKRERINWQRKVLATDVLPFFILKPLVGRISKQINDEKDYLVYQTILEQIEDKEFISLLTKAMKEIGSSSAIDDGQKVHNDIRNYFTKQNWSGFVPLFGLSEDDEAQVQIALGRISSTDVGVFKHHQKRIVESLERSKSIRLKIQNSDVEHFEEYIRENTRLEEEEKLLELKINYAHEQIEKFSQELVSLETQLRTAKKSFEDHLKKESVSAISGKLLLLLEELQKELYTKLIENVQKDVNMKFRELIRKEDFFTEIRIDENFSIHLLRMQDVSCAEIAAQLKGNSLTPVQNAIGKYALLELQEILGTASVAGLRSSIKKVSSESIILPVEINKDYLSSGEKQIFVMALYWALMQQSKNDLPYIIDTPFARIDTQHRANITKHFFKQLEGQLIILSTDEELSNEHIISLKEQIAHIYLLEYGQDKRTHIHDNVYFEV